MGEKKILEARYQNESAKLVEVQAKVTILREVVWTHAYIFQAIKLYLEDAHLEGLPFGD